MGAGAPPAGPPRRGEDGAARTGHSGPSAASRPGLPPERTALTAQVGGAFFPQREARPAGCFFPDTAAHGAATPVPHAAHPLRGHRPRPVSCDHPRLAPARFHPAAFRGLAGVRGPAGCGGGCRMDGAHQGLPGEAEWTRLGGRRGFAGLSLSLLKQVPGRRDVGFASGFCSDVVPAAGRAAAPRSGRGVRGRFGVSPPPRPAGEGPMDGGGCGGGLENVSRPADRWKQFSVTWAGGASPHEAAPSVSRKRPHVGPDAALVFVYGKQRGRERVSEGRGGPAGQWRASAPSWVLGSHVGPLLSFTFPGLGAPGFLTCIAICSVPRFSKVGTPVKRPCGTGPVSGTGRPGTFLAHSSGQAWVPDSGDRRPQGVTVPSGGLWGVELVVSPGSGNAVS